MLRRSYSKNHFSCKEKQIVRKQPKQNNININKFMNTRIATNFEAIKLRVTHS